MSIHRFEIAVSIDDERLAGHSGEQNAPPTDPSAWDASDLFRAAALEVVDVRASKITRYEGQQDRGVVRVTVELPEYDATYSAEWEVRGPTD